MHADARAARGDGEVKAVTHLGRAALTAAVWLYAQAGGRGGGAAAEVSADLARSLLGI